MQSTLSESGLELEAPGLMRLASRLAGAPDAEDLVQATYVRALENEEPVRARRSWLRQVLVNERRMDLRGYERRRRREAAVVEEPEATDLEDVVHCLEVARIVGSLVDELDDDVRTVVRQRYFEGKSAAEIARGHALPAGTVRWRLKTGLDRLRTQLDKRYGGRRALWAGAFAPTLSTEAASPSLTAGANAAAAKGTKIMSLKVLVGAAIVAATAGGVVLAAGSSAPEQPEAKVQAVAEAPAPKQAKSHAPVVVAVEEASPEEPEVAAPEVAAKQAAWKQRVSKIHAAHTEEHHVWKHAEDSDESCEDEHCVGMCTDDTCLTTLANEVLAMFSGCSEFMDHAQTDLSLTASIVGAPDVGTVVESVELGDSDAPEELTECLREAMYTLELDDTDSNFQQEITVQVASSMAPGSVHGLEDLDDETRAKVQEALEKAAAEGGHGEVKAVFLEAGSFDHGEQPED